MELTEAEIERLTALASTVPTAPTISINWAHERKKLREGVEKGTISAETFIREMDDVREAERLELDDQHRRPAIAQTASDMRAALQQWSAMVGSAKGQPHEAELWSNIAARYFDRFQHVGPDRIRPVPNEAGIQAFVTSTMPSQVVLARPEAFSNPRPADPKSAALIH